jgi:hypothetical protein
MLNPPNPYIRLAGASYDIQGQANSNNQNTNVQKWIPHQVRNDRCGIDSIRGQISPLRNAMHCFGRNDID